MKKTKSVKIVFIGDTAVGKTSIIEKFMKDTFDAGHIASTGATFISKSLSFDEYNTVIRMQIWDTAGQERFRSLASVHYKNANAVIMVYSITKKESFEALRTWYEEILNKSPKNTLVLLVGNKADLIDSQEVSENDAMKFAEEIGARLFLTSAKDGMNILDLFRGIPMELGLLTKDEPPLNGNTPVTKKKKEEETTKRESMKLKKKGEEKK